MLKGKYPRFPVQVTISFAFLPVKITGEFRFVWLRHVVFERRYYPLMITPNRVCRTEHDFFLYKIQSDDTFITYRETLLESFTSSLVTSPLFLTSCIILFVMGLLSL